jgi:hypothetical protein
MKTYTAVLIALVTCLTVAAAAQDGANTGATAIPAGSKVYVAPMDGFENYLIAALDKKHVPLVVVANREQADFEIKGSSESQKAGWADKIFLHTSASKETASVQVINLKTGIVAYAAASDKYRATHGHKSTAEAVAKSIRAKIQGQK